MSKLPYQQDDCHVGVDPRRDYVHRSPALPGRIPSEGDRIPDLQLRVVGALADERQDQLAKPAISLGEDPRPRREVAQQPRPVKRRRVREMLGIALADADPVVLLSRVACGRNIAACSPVSMTTRWVPRRGRDFAQGGSHRMRTRPRTPDEQRSIRKSGSSQGHLRHVTPRKSSRRHHPAVFRPRDPGFLAYSPSDGVQCGNVAGEPQL